MVRVNSKKDLNWLAKALEGLKIEGYAIIEDVLDPQFIQESIKGLHRVEDIIVPMMGKQRLLDAGELGVLRITAKYDNFFLKYLELPELLQIVDHTVSSTAVLHVQQGSILPSFPKGQAPPVFQNVFHMDFPRYLNSYLASINCFFAISPFTKENGGTLLVPGTHQKAERPSEDYLKANSISVECPAGTMFIFDSTLYHAAGENNSGENRYGINHQFTRAFFKQQIDYVRALGDNVVKMQKDRTQQLLGWYTRIPSSLEEYYRAPDDRLYRKGQG
ncbi:MAG TPA: phytanoyl-CoA dioxygenase family protein [bacterium]|jgi:ectoine hydroxylase-related dioxygenase (phytanoyl-CoA dioxygenase family)|nr:phytanoyl-CoA dioxygenase family protein [bacterium]